MRSIIEYSVRTHKGFRKRTNQDNNLIGGSCPGPDGEGFAGSPDGRLSAPQLFGVFDGMGGEACGETAAFLAAKEAAGFRLEGDPVSGLVGLCRRANRRITDHAAEHGIASMGTTAAMVLCTKKTVYVCNVGDSRVYRFSENGLEKLSVDHVSELVFGRKPTLSQNLGMPEDFIRIEPSVTSAGSRDGDVYLICSDGLTDMVSEERISGILSEGFEGASDRLIEEALNNGGRDNVTVLLLKTMRRGLLF